MSFRLTYATMHNSPEAMHERFEAALARVEAALGARHPLFIAGADRDAAQHADRRSPIDTQLRLGEFALADDTDVDAAMAAARDAFPAWRATPVAERARLQRRVGDLLAERVYDIAAAMVLEVGKNRMEALGETQETVDFFHHYADDFERNAGYAHTLPDDPIEGYASHNASVMRPYGVWVVIAPFNFPLALAGGPTAAALVTGNTVVLKGASDTPWAGRLLADCIRDAGLPPGVFNYLSGSGREAGEALVRHPLTAGITFTGSVAVGRHIMQQMAAGAWPRPCIAEMGGKNPCIVTERADLDRAAAGIVRSAYGMGGQKCSALSRLYVHERVADALLERLRQQIAAIRVGDPRRREHWLGPVINANAYASYARYAGELRNGGAHLLCGGAQLGQGSGGPAALARGYYVEPLLAEAPLAHPLWQHEMFLPILMLHRYRDRDEAMRLANDTPMGLTAGFFGGADEVAWFQDHIEAGVTYANRPQGATTGAWPGYQPFGGWKGSGSTGKAIASFYYLAQYLREQSRTVVE
ncbi:NAD-dependent aldehyde dehydrogenase [Mizugakiibacter sediminis]|uniref:L-glutamate gamma-semialdehyde dehydrogenase n=1 Tax=Mizugakiibacter sediminis TaxID=1475481 RepID=A0A0K8QRH6_9GAMM|nr:aldehyde dehydrogenase family protein [Mizugakiibacter sediminis]GAP67503.1 NAD-dependent aldehyde dehydrogenase [Mizugakiibacter sediminis]